jgi:hypothetical protein
MKFYIVTKINDIIEEKEIDADKFSNQGDFTIFKKGKKEFFILANECIISINTQSYNKKEINKKLTLAEMRKLRNQKIVDSLKLRQYK